MPLHAKGERMAEKIVARDKDHLVQLIKETIEKKVQIAISILSMCRR